LTALRLRRPCASKVLLWVYGEQLRAMFDNVVLAEYRCRYNWQTR
jgi:hypothetical protein